MTRALLISVLALFMASTTPTLFAQTTTFIVNSNSDDSNARDADAGDGACADANGRCTLRAAVDEANASSGDVVIIVPGRLPNGVGGTYTLSAVAPNMAANTYEDENAYGDLDLNGSFSSLTLQGTGTPGPTITISPNDRILHVGSSATVFLFRLHLTGGKARAGNNGTSDGSGVGVDGENGDDGGALLVGENATVEMDQLTFSSNATQSGGNGATPASSIERTAGGDAGDGGDGGAVYISTGASVTATRCTFYQNGTGDAGGAAAGQATDGAAGGQGGDAGSGGAIYNAGTLTLKSCTVNANTCGSPGSGGSGVNGGSNGLNGDGGNGGGIANAQNVNGSLTNQGTLSITNTVIAGNTAGDAIDNGTVTGDDLFDDSDGGTITDNGNNLIGSNGGVTALFSNAAGLIGSPESPLDPIFTGLNENDDEAVPTLAIGSGSPLIDAGTTITGMDYDAKGFVRPNDGGSADIGATEANSVPTPDELQISEVDVNNTDGGMEFVEITNTGDFPVQMDDYVLVGFGDGNTSCLSVNLYGELQPGDFFVVADDGVDKTNHKFSLDMPQDACGSNGANQFNNTSGAVVLYEGGASNFSGISAGTREDARMDIIVYDNSGSNAGGSNTGLNQRRLPDLCSAFNLDSGCAGVDGGDNQSIQRALDGSLATGTPSPGADNGQIALPVNWVSFAATSPKAGVAELSWRTSGEVDNDGFMVEMSHEGGSWKEAGWVAATESVGAVNDYAYRLENLPMGTFTFRLRQIDLDGTESLSELINLTMMSGGAIRVFPNPAAEEVQVRLTTTGPLRLRLHDATGRVILDRSWKEVDEGILPLTNVAAGSYYLNVISSEGQEAVRLVVR